MLNGRGGTKTGPLRTERLGSDDRGARPSWKNGHFKLRHVTWLK